MSKSIQSRDDGRPDVNDLEGDNEWTQLAHKHWRTPVKSRKVKNEVIKNDIWDSLENEGFPFRTLLVLENLQLLEKFVHSVEKVKTGVLM